MNILYLLAIIVGIAGQGALKKPYMHKTNGKGVYLFTAIVSLVAMAFFTAAAGKLSFAASTLPYSLGFAAAYAVSTVFGTLAIATGPLSLTSLFSSYSLMIPTFYGLLFLKDPIGAGLIPGIALLAASLLLINYRKEKSQENGLSMRWLLYVFVSFVGNGMCSTVQKMQQVAFEGAYKSEFMIAALAMVTAAMLLLSAGTERGRMKAYAAAGWLPAALCGVLNGMVNLFVMILNGKMPASIMFPMISAGGIIASYLISRFFYREKLTRMQFAGFLAGIASVVFLNL